LNWAGGAVQQRKEKEMNLKPNILVLMAALALMLTPRIQGQRTSPPYLSQFPSVDRVKGEIRGADATDTAARQSAAFWWLNQIAMAVGGSGKLVTSSDSGLLYSRYIAAFRSYAQIYASGRNLRWEQLLETYKYDPVFGDELIKRFFTADFRAGYYKFSGKQPPQMTTSLPKTPPTSQPSAAAGGRLYYDAAGNWKYQDQWGGVYDKNGYTWADGSLTTNSRIQVKADQPNIVDNGDGTKTDLRQVLGRTATLQEARQFAINQEESLQAAGYSQPNTAEAILSKVENRSSGQSEPSPRPSVSGKYEKAVAEFREAIRLNPKDPDNYLDLGKAYLAAGQKAQAQQVYTTLRRLDPNKAQELLAEINKAPDAQPAPKSAAASQPAPNPSPSRVPRRAVAQAAPKTQNARTGVGTAPRSRTGAETSQDESRTLLAGNLPNNPVADELVAKGYEYLDKKDYQNAIETLKKAITLRPSDSDAHLFLATAYDEQGQYQLAITTYQQYLKLKPNAALIYARLGLAYKSLKQYEEALKAFRKAIALDPSTALAHYGMGMVYETQEQYQLSITAFEKYLQQKPDDILVLLFVGKQNRTLKQFDQALKAYRKVLTLKAEPEEVAFAQKGIGETLSDMGQYEQAVPALREAVRVKPDDADSSRSLGIAYYKLGQNQNAVAAFQQTVRLQPNDQAAYLGMGLAFLDMGQKNQAMRVYQRLLTLNKETAKILYDEINKVK
jgi:tetratricopeptide (TPR) repeat protein